MLKSENLAQILSSSSRHRWSRVAPSIWTTHSEKTLREITLAIARTLFDQPRWLEPRYLYDERGSELFEQISQLPQYYLTRTEEAILAKEAERLIAAAPVGCIVELGAGFSKKTIHLLQEQSRQREGGVYAPIDVSFTALSSARETILRQVPAIAFHGLHASYEEGIASIRKDLPTLFVFLGSSIGNFTPSDFSCFFRLLSDCMGPNDYFLLGVDRIKASEIIEKAYNDPDNVSAKFILNIFRHVNCLTGSNFDLRRMRYAPRYDPARQQVEMYAVASSNQEVAFPVLDLSFQWEKEERILVEISRKFDPLRLQRQLELFRLKLLEHQTDTRQWFSVMLFQKR